MLPGITRQQQDNFQDAHDDGMHVDDPREGCPSCR